MATIRSEIQTQAPAGEVWSAIRDIGALHPVARLEQYGSVIMRKPIDSPTRQQSEGSPHARRRQAD